MILVLLQPKLRKISDITCHPEVSLAFSTLLFSFRSPYRYVPLVVVWAYFSSSVMANGRGTNRLLTDHTTLKSPIFFQKKVVYQNWINYPNTMRVKIDFLWNGHDLQFHNVLCSRHHSRPWLWSLLNTKTVCRPGEKLAISEEIDLLMSTTSIWNPAILTTQTARRIQMTPTEIKPTASTETTAQARSPDQNVLFSEF